MRLSLPWAWTTCLAPFVAIGIYILAVVVVLKHTKRWIQAAGILVGFLLAFTVLWYPSLILKLCSQKIEFHDVDRDHVFETVTAFEEEFDTPVLLQYGGSDTHVLIVPRRTYSDSMRTWLEEREAEVSQPAPVPTVEPVETTPG